MATNLDIESIAHLDFTHSIKCENRGGLMRKNGEVHSERDCPNEAAWLVTHLICCPEKSRYTYWCYDCLKEKLMTPRLVCRYCRHVAEPGATAYENWTPIA